MEEGVTNQLSTNVGQLTHPSPFPNPCQPQSSGRACSSLTLLLLGTLTNPSKSANIHCIVSPIQFECYQLRKQPRRQQVDLDCPELFLDFGVWHI